jgi:hypothetical protein
METVEHAAYRVDPGDQFVCDLFLHQLKVMSQEQLAFEFRE